MRDYIPFVNGEADCELVAKYYSDSAMARLTLEKADRLVSSLPKGLNIWLDPGVDGFNRPYSDSPSSSWKTHMERFRWHKEIGDPVFHAKPDSSKVEEFVFALLRRCAGFKPRAISVPQLPMTNGADRNSMNRALASATAKWKVDQAFAGWLILPAVFTDQKQLNKKSDRNSKCRVIKACYERSQADGLWVVDSTLQDQTGSPTFRNKRFPGLVAFHEEINGMLPDSAITIAGPYWGMNLVLWAKGLCRFPAIGVGGAYQYHLAGGQQHQPTVKLAVPPLRRWARVSSQFRSWLSDAMAKLDSSDAAYKSLAYLRDNYSTLSDRQVSRDQIAKFYRNWLDEIESVPQAGRALALYQMLSTAYVLGKGLPSLPASEKTARRPERVAEYLMLNCL